MVGCESKAARRSHSDLRKEDVSSDCVLKGLSLAKDRRQIEIFGRFDTSENQEQQHSKQSKQDESIK